MDFITQRKKLKEAFPDLVHSIADQYGKKEEDLSLIRKGLVASKIEFQEGERAVISIISTGAKDRDNEIVDPNGAILDDYRKNPIVLFGHNHWDLPIGKNEWIKQDGGNLIAKTIYAGHAEAEKVYQYRKDGFPLAESIGFIPLEWIDYGETERAANGGVRRKYTKWVLLEYSDVPVPANPEAISLAVSKGLLEKEVKELLVERSETWSCPHCKAKITEADIIYDGNLHYHKGCTSKGAISLPIEPVLELQPATEIDLVPDLTATLKDIQENIVVIQKTLLDSAEIILGPIAETETGTVLVDSEGNTILLDPLEVNGIPVDIAKGAGTPEVAIKDKGAPENNSELEGMDEFEKLLMSEIEEDVIDSEEVDEDSLVDLLKDIDVTAIVTGVVKENVSS